MAGTFEEDQTSSIYFQAQYKDVHYTLENSLKAPDIQNIIQNCF